VGVAALVLLLGAAGCDSGDDIQGDGDKDAQTADQATDAPPEVSTFVTLQHVGNRLDAVHRERVKDRVAEVVDPFFDGAYLGEFPRSDYTGAFATFTEGAAADAQGDLDIMSNAAIADQIDSAEATKRRVIVNVFAVQGHPKGATAHFYLDFDTTGDLESSMRVRGELYLAKVKGQWKIFGYDVDEAEQR
ncbi:MAG TPA: hypothetical protein PK324_17450, partial [Nocardioides sp.]|nr:hypothetical protein [Nocardioides sp.]